MATAIGSAHTTHVEQVANRQFGTGTSLENVLAEAERAKAEALANAEYQRTKSYSQASLDFESNEFTLAFANLNSKESQDNADRSIEMQEDRIDDEYSFYYQAHSTYWTRGNKIRRMILSHSKIALTKKMKPYLGILETGAV